MWLGLAEERGRRACGPHPPGTGSTWDLCKASVPRASPFPGAPASILDPFPSTLPFCCHPSFPSQPQPEPDPPCRGFHSAAGFGAVFGVSGLALYNWTCAQFLPTFFLAAQSWAQTTLRLEGQDLQAGMWFEKA